MNYGKENVSPPHNFNIQLLVLHYTHHIKMACLLKGVRLSKFSKSFYKSPLVANFVQTYSLISIHNGMYTVFSYDTPQ